MFKKIVSNLSFSPALVGQLGFYAKRLKKEEATRRLGLVFVALALVVQSLVVFQPPESANAAHPSDFVPGGLGLGANRSLNNFIAPYDANSKNLKDIMNYFGITRAEITSAQFSSWKAASNRISYGHTARPGATAVPILRADGSQVTTIYGRVQNTYWPTGTTVYGWVGYSAKMGWFAIMQSCGNLVTERIPSPPPPPTPPTPPPVVPPTVTPPPAPEPAKIELSKSAANVNQGNVVASTVAARENDRISFTLSAKNTGGTAKEVTFTDDLTDALEYATLIDRGGGTFNETTRVLSWPVVNLQPGATEARTFAIKINDTIPATPVGQSDNNSYDCVIDNVFGTSSVVIPVTCAPPKVIEQVTTELPRTGPAENMVFAAVVLSVVTFFFFRSKQLSKEVRLIRRDLNAGTL